MYYLSVFFVYSIIGFVYEILLALFLGNPLNSGILYGPWTPIYGFGALIILFLSKYIFKKLKFNKVLEVFIFFVIITIILTLIEFIAGNLIEKLFHTSLWNYKELKFNYGKYIALEVSLAWGGLSLLLLYVIHPKLKKLIKNIPRCITISLAILFIIDVIIKVFSL